MKAMFSAEYQWLWTIVLGLALLLPVRKVIWVMSVRRRERREGSIDEAARASLKRRAIVTSLLLCFVFSLLYVDYLFTKLYAPQ